MITADVFSTVLDKSTKLPKALVSIKGWSGLAIFDTGATDSIISLKIFNKLGHLPKQNIEKFTALVKLPNMQLVSSTHIINVPVVLAGRVHWQRFLVIPDLACDVILGNDYLVAAGVVPVNARNGYTFEDLLPADIPIKKYDEEIHPTCRLFTLTTKCTAPQLSPQQKLCFSQGELRDDLTTEQKHALATTLLQFRDTITDQRIGYTDIHMHTIDTGNAEPIKQAPYQAKPPRQKIIDENIDQLIIIINIVIT
jgi:hypothetical protein